MGVVVAGGGGACFTCVCRGEALADTTAKGKCLYRCGLKKLGPKVFGVDERITSVKHASRVFMCRTGGPRGPCNFADSLTRVVKGAFWLTVQYFHSCFVQWKSCLGRDVALLLVSGLCAVKLQANRATSMLKRGLLPPPHDVTHCAAPRYAAALTLDERHKVALVKEAVIRNKHAGNFR